MEKFCPKCGYKSDFKFCPNCGFNLSNIRLPGEQPSQPKESDLKRLFVENYPAYKQAVAYREEHSAPEKLSMENSPEQTSYDQDTNQLLREILSSLEHQPPQAEYISPAQELGSLDQLSPPESSPTFSTVPQSQEDTPAYPVGYNVPVVQEQIIQQDLSDHPSDINASETAQGVQNPCLSYNEHQGQASSGQEIPPHSNEHIHPVDQFIPYWPITDRFPTEYAEKRRWLSACYVPMDFFKFQRIAGIVVVILFWALMMMLSIPLLAAAKLDSAFVLIVLLPNIVLMAFATIEIYLFFKMESIGYTFFLIGTAISPFMINPLDDTLAGLLISVIPILFVQFPVLFLQIWYYEKRRFLFMPQKADPPIVQRKPNGAIKLVATPAIRTRILLIFGTDLLILLVFVGILAIERL